MPGWHEKTLSLQQQGKLRVVGIIQEQHPDRCQLFLQWKQMDLPILVDSLNLLGVEAVPVTVFLDEHGVVRSGRLPLRAADTFEQDFLARDYPAPAEAPGRLLYDPSELPRLEAAAQSGDAASLRRFAHAAFLWGGEERLDDAIDAYHAALNLDPGDGATHFRLGVALRARYDSAHRRREDFQQAVEQWKAALDIDPNQYIWRRRIQQYGPRLDKPYPFYDWVPAARSEIEARGETPVPLRVEPGGAEFAKPSKQFVPEQRRVEEPDPAGKVYRDEGEFVDLYAAAAPPSVAPGEAARLHVEMEPRRETQAHWNNEADDLIAWVDVPAGCEAGQRLFRVPRPPRIVSRETRKIEWEVRCGEDASAGQKEAKGYALYYVCEDERGACLYRRQDFRVPFEIREP